MDLYNPKEILPLSIEPDEKEIFDVWIQQEDVIPFLEKEIEDDNKSATQLDRWDAVYCPGRQWPCCGAR